jgi:hypothetical protein
MKRNTFALKTKGWHRLIENAPSLAQVAGPEAPFPREVVLPGPGSATIWFAESTAQAVQARPDVLRKPRHFTKVLLPDLLASALHPENQGLALDLEAVLTDEDVLGVDLGHDTEVDGVARTFRRALAAATEVRHLLARGRSDGAVVTYGSLAADADCPPRHGDPLGARLDAVVGLARELAEQLGKDYVPLPNGNVGRAEQLFQKLIVQAVGARTHWEAQLGKAHAKVEAGWDMVHELIRQVSVAHGFIEDLKCAALPPMLVPQWERARIDFDRTCRRVVDAVASGAAMDASESIVRALPASAAALFDAWNPSRHLGDHDVAADLMVLVQVVESVVRTPPFDAYLKRGAGIAKLLKATHRVFPDRPVVLGVVGSPAAVRRASAYLELEPPARSLTEAYRCLTKRLAGRAVLAEHGFDVKEVKSTLGGFYQSVRPPVFCSGLMALRAYQVYRDACAVLGITPKTQLAEKAFFADGPSETLVPAPLAWSPPPLAPREAAEAVALCRDLVLSFTQTPGLPEEWVVRLLPLLYGDRPLAIEDHLREYQQLREELLSGAKRLVAA